MRQTKYLNVYLANLFKPVKCALLINHIDIVISFITLMQILPSIQSFFHTNKTMN